MSNSWFNDFKIQSRVEDIYNVTCLIVFLILIFMSLFLIWSPGYATKRDTTWYVCRVYIIDKLTCGLRAHDNDTSSNTMFQ